MAYIRCCYFCYRRHETRNDILFSEYGSVRVICNRLYSKQQKILYYLVLGAVVVLIFAENSIKELLYSTIAMIALSAVLLIIQFGFDVTLLKENKTYLIIQIMSSFVIAFTAFIVRYMFEQFGKSNAFVLKILKNE